MELTCCVCHFGGWLLTEDGDDHDMSALTVINGMAVCEAHSGIQSMEGFHSYIAKVSRSLGDGYPEPSE